MIPPDNNFWTPGCDWKGPVNQGIILELGHHFFLEITPCCVVHESCIFWKKYFCPKNGKMGQKIGFFLRYWKIQLLVFLNLVYNPNVYYLLDSCANSILGKNLVLEILAKILLANQIVGFLNQLYLKNKLIRTNLIFRMLIQIHEN